MRTVLSVVELMYQAPWPSATDMEGNTYEQIDNICTDEKHGLRWAVEDLQTILEDLEPGAASRVG